MNWLDAYLTLAFFPATCLALLACIWLLRWAVKIARLPDDKLNGA
jgi:hypothetical protein